MNNKELLKETFSSPRGKLALIMSLGGLCVVFASGIFSKVFTMPMFLVLAATFLSFIGTRMLINEMNIIRSEAERNNKN